MEMTFTETLLLLMFCNILSESYIVKFFTNLLFKLCKYAYYTQTLGTGKRKRGPVTSRACYRFQYVACTVPRTPLLQK